MRLTGMRLCRIRPTGMHLAAMTPVQESGGSSQLQAKGVNTVGVKKTVSPVTFKHPINYGELFKRQPRGYRGPGWLCRLLYTLSPRGRVGLSSGNQHPTASCHTSLPDPLTRSA
ncbi:hypothetical protein BaRGS_00003246 [Batillaria attramentaria]|uniref:Uncharacterized protein n=1 Tax=Batillaria attramentaria TaxID=370345 RepID=A0ABD0M2H3_9CAEN